MQKSLTFKRKVYEVDAIQFKGEENLQEVKDFLHEQGLDVASKVVSQKFRAEKLTVIEYRHTNIWSDIYPGFWIVFGVPDYSPTFCEILTPKEFAARYEGV